MEAPVTTTQDAVPAQSGATASALPASAAASSSSLSASSSSSSSSDTVWNLLWSSLWPPSRPARGRSRAGGGRTTRQSLLLPRALKTVVAKLDDPPAATTTTTSSSSSSSSSSWFSCLQLALWDNIFGPRVEQVWHRPSSKVSEDLQITFARQSLSGELGEEEEELNDRMETKFHVFAEMGYIMLAVIFTGRLRGSVSKFSFCLLAPLSNLTRYLMVHQIVENRLLHLVASLRLLMLRGREASQVLARFSLLLPQFVSTTQGLFRVELRPADPARTVFCQDLRHSRFAAYDHSFFYRAITSHLVTQHHTVVMGSDLKLVNAWVDSLSFFLLKRELPLSARAHKGAVFVPDLVLQGLPTQELKDETVIWCRGPITVIDLDQESVRQSVPLHQHTTLRRDYFEALQFGQIPAPLSSPTLDRARPLFPEEGLLRDFGAEWSGWVAEVVDEAWRLPVSVREGFIRQALRILTRRAALLVKYVDAQLAKTSFVDMALVQGMRTELELEQEQDFLVVLAVADRLSPGIHTTLVGNPAALEDKFIQLFESF